MTEDNGMNDGFADGTCDAMIKAGVADYETIIVEPVKDGEWITLKPGTHLLTTVTNQGATGNSWGHATANAIEINLAAAEQAKKQLYPVTMTIDGILQTIMQEAEPPKPKTPRSTIAPPSTPLKERKKLLKAKKR